MPTEDHEIPLYQGKKCWKDRNVPHGLIQTKDDKVKLKKQHYWSDKVNASNFGLEIVTKKCSNEL